MVCDKGLFLLPKNGPADMILRRIFVDFVDIILENVLLLHWKQVVMWIIGGLLIYLAIKKNMEPSLLLPIGFGAILVNLPL